MTLEKEKRTDFSMHKSGAKRRGVEFTLTFAQWCEVWGDKYQNRGNHLGQYNMCRTRDEGGYTPGNVRIATVTENQHERAVAQHVKKAQRPKLPRMTVCDPVPKETSWLYKRNPFEEYSEDEEDC